MSVANPDWLRVKDAPRSPPSLACAVWPPPSEVRTPPRLALNASSPPPPIPEAGSVPHGLIVYIRKLNLLRSMKPDICADVAVKPRHGAKKLYFKNPSENLKNHCVTALASWQGLTRIGLRLFHFLIFFWFFWRKIGKIIKSNTIFCCIFLLLKVD